MCFKNLRYVTLKYASSHLFSLGFICSLNGWFIRNKLKIDYSKLLSVVALSGSDTISFRLRVVELSSSSGNFSVLSNVEKFVEKSVDIPCFDFKPEPGQGVEDARIKCATCHQQLCKILFQLFFFVLHFNVVQFKFYTTLEKVRNTFFWH